MFGGRLWFVTRNAQRVSETDPPSEAAAGAPVGPGRSPLTRAAPLGRAHRSTRGASEADVRRPWPPSSSNPTGKIRWRSGRAHASRHGSSGLRPDGRRTAIDLSARCHVSDHRGLGTIGLRTAQWLVEHEGVRSLVLTGRRGGHDRNGPALETLRRTRRAGLVISADVSVAADVRRLMEALRASRRSAASSTVPGSSTTRSSSIWIGRGSRR